MDKQLLPKVEMTKQLSYVLIGFMIIFIVIADFFLIMKPQLRALASLRKKIVETSQGVKETKDNLQRLPALREEIVKLKEKLGSVENSILPREEAIMMVDKISRLAAKSSVRINQIAPLSNAETKVLSNEQGEYFSLPIALSAEGGYHEIGTFFYNLENDETFMSIDNFEIMKDAGSAKKNIVTVTVNVFIVKKK